MSSFLNYRALVEVKPILFVPESIDAANEDLQELLSCINGSNWGFQHVDWHSSCIQKSVVHGKLCMVVLNVTSELAANICSDPLGIEDGKVENKKCITEGQMQKVSRFCIYLLDGVITGNGFSWKDTMVSFP